MIYTKIEDLEDKLVHQYDEVLNDISKNDNAKVIIWGAGNVARQLINFVDSKWDIIIWDTYAHGSKLRGHDIIKPNMNLNEEMKTSVWVILSFYDDALQAEINETLSKNGFKNCINGKELLDHIIASRILKDYCKYDESNKNDDFMIDKNNLRIPMYNLLGDAGAGFDDYYLNQSLWAAKKICGDKPIKHYDIGSSVHGFIVCLLSCGIDTVMIDVRPLDTFATENLTFIQSDAKNLENIESESVESLSALGSLFTFGLGQYGDPVDPEADLKAYKSVQRVMKSNGDFYFSAPVSDKNYLKFNTHRGYKPEYIANIFDKMNLIEFSYVSEGKGLIANQPLILSDSGDKEGYYLGLFHFRKK